jgi:hypothetical protein
MIMDERAPEADVGSTRTCAGSNEIVDREPARRHGECFCCAGRVGGIENFAVRLVPAHISTFGPTEVPLPQLDRIHHAHDSTIASQMIHQLVKRGATKLPAKSGEQADR